MWNSLKDLARLVDEHLARRPAMQLQDVYKLLYQGVRGPEHLIATPGDFVAHLRAEWEAIGADDTEPVLESIRPDKGLARANLRGLKALGGDVETLAASCLQAAHHDWGTPDNLRQAWSTFVQICRDETVTTYAPDELSAFSHWLEEHGYPVIHHSRRYRELYRPAYRLVEPSNPLRRG